MPLRRIVPALAALLAFAAPAVAQDAMPEMGPTPEIQKMAKETVGTWDVVMKYKMSADQPEWSESEGVAVFSTILDGCAVVMDYTTDMMGMKMHGISTTVYDREAREWVEAWVDNMTGRMSVYRGGFQGDDLVTQGPDMMQGMSYLSRNTVSNRTADRYDWKAEMSFDNGETWITWATAVYSRRK